MSCSFFLQLSVGFAAETNAVAPQLPSHDSSSLTSIQNITIERFHSRAYRPYWFTETKESICINIECNSQSFSLGHQHGRLFFVLVHQHGRRDVM